MEKIFQEAMKDRKMAAVVLGQAILDEGSIGTDVVKLLYHSEELARKLWEIGHKWNWVNSFQIHRYKDNRRPNEIKMAWRFGFKKPAVKEIYEIIGELPETRKDQKMKRFLRFVGKTPDRIPNLREELLKTVSSPKTLEEVMDELNITAHMARDNLRTLVKVGKVFTKKINGYEKFVYHSKEY